MIPSTGLTPFAPLLRLDAGTAPILPHHRLDRLSPHSHHFLASQTSTAAPRRHGAAFGISGYSDEPPVGPAAQQSPAAASTDAPPHHRRFPAGYAGSPPPPSESARTTIRVGPPSESARVDDPFHDDWPHW